ncbi:MAG: hypothetical protein LBN22_02630, partial [Clostridiales Family XIII bacterium]|nr:hypothetical protein [Clostridiales Family XIII bacterium]
MNDKVLTFLGRANQVKLENIDTSLVAFYYKKIFTDAHKELSGDRAQYAAKLTDGFAYLVQLLGYNMWKYSDDAVSDDVFELAIIQSK